MQIVPVIDLQAGHVVHASGGVRANYSPIHSALVRSSDPLTVAQVLCEHCATDTLYLADLDAIASRAPHIAAVARMLREQPRLRVWLDAGFAHASDIENWTAALGGLASRVVPVLASESLASVKALREACAAWPQALLSLDSRAGQPLDPACVWDRPDAWPTRVIAMDLARVGSAAGPDVAHLRSLQARAPQAGWIGSGGVRDEADLARAAASGAQAWLVASALHSGAIPARPRGAVARSTATACGLAFAAH